METTKQRRPPQPPIDPARVVKDSRWQKNRAEDIGRAVPIFVIVDSVDIVAANPPWCIVHYHNEATGRRGKMPLDAFCQGSEHRLPDVEPEPVEPPPSGERVAQHGTLEEQVFRLTLESAEQTKMLVEMRAMLRKLCGPAQLELSVAK